MEQYEIRIVRQGHSDRVYPSLQTGDYAAIRRGQALAKARNGFREAFEVWRADTCVYRQSAEALLGHL